MNTKEKPMMQPAAGGIHPEKAEKVSVTLAFEQDLLDEIDSRARETCRSRAGFLRMAAIHYLEDLKNGEQ